MPIGRELHLPARRAGDELLLDGVVEDRRQRPVVTGDTRRLPLADPSLDEGLDFRRGDLTDRSLRERRQQMKA
jgi:hypothetical protein